ncbi:hypothetical protein SRHO_G00097790 [Serrasalmus rhombeus]
MPAAWKATVLSLQYTNYTVLRSSTHSLEGRVICLGCETFWGEIQTSLLVSFAAEQINLQTMNHGTTQKVRGYLHLHMNGRSHSHPE